MVCLNVASPHPDSVVVVVVVVEGMVSVQARMAMGIHGLPKVSPRLAMPDPPTSFWGATPKTALRPFWGWRH
jgi:hypothetical protein